MKPSKKNTTKSVSTPVAAPAAQPTAHPNAVVGEVADPPTVTVPGTPLGYDPNTMTAPRGGRALGVVVGYSGAVATEILGSSTFAQDFGTKLPAAELAGLLTKAAGWRQRRKEAIQWAEYVKYGDSEAWGVARREIERFRNTYDAAVAVDAAVATRHPQLDALFKAMSAPALKAGATRRRNKAQATAAKETVVKAAAATDTAATDTAATGQGRAVNSPSVIESK